MRHREIVDVDVVAAICTWIGVGRRPAVGHRRFSTGSSWIGGGGRLSDESRSQPAGGERLGEQLVHALRALRHHRRDAIAVGRGQREAADNLIVGSVAADEPSPRRAAGIEPLELDLGDEDVGRAVQIDDVAPPAAPRPLASARR